jgi:hypothetical protein
MFVRRKQLDRQLAAELEFHMGSRTRIWSKLASRKPKLEGAPISNLAGRKA